MVNLDKKKRKRKTSKKAPPKKKTIIKKYYYRPQMPATGEFTTRGSQPIMQSPYSIGLIPSMLSQGYEDPNLKANRILVEDFKNRNRELERQKNFLGESIKEITLEQEIEENPQYFDEDVGGIISEDVIGVTPEEINKNIPIQFQENIGSKITMDPITHTETQKNENIPFKYEEVPKLPLIKSPSESGESVLSEIIQDSIFNLKTGRWVMKTNKDYLKALKNEELAKNYTIDPILIAERKTKKK